jgi:serine/threonine protein kinase
MNKMIGKTIGKYKILKLIGNGGMADVYYAEHNTLKSGAAIKHLFPNLASNPSVVKRFELEGQRMAKIIHPNVVRVFDYEKNDEGMFLIMEYVDGSDANKKLAALKGEPMNILDAKGIINQVLEAFKCIHGMGIVHRDIKPANIMISNNGVVKITDFGISGIMNEGELEKTKMGSAGTIPYMSPEQITSEAIGPSSDIYSIGVTFYELLVGGNPYASYKSTFLVQEAILNSPLPSLVDSMGDEYQHVWNVISRATQKESNLRYADCASFLDAIEGTIIDPIILKPGCTDKKASNFDIEAKIDDGSCIYEEEVVIDNNNFKVISLFSILALVLNFLVINSLIQGVILILSFLCLIYYLREKPKKSIWTNLSYILIVLSIVLSSAVGWYSVNVLDQDKDGISDFYDACPEQYGLEKHSGCEE